VLPQRRVSFRILRPGHIRTAKTRKSTSRGLVLRQQKRPEIFLTQVGGTMYTSKSTNAARKLFLGHKLAALLLTASVTPARTADTQEGQKRPSSLCMLRLDRSDLIFGFVLLSGLPIKRW
jgi:hypothetical protein